MLTALQPAIFSILANNGNIACSPPFSSKARSQRELGARGEGCWLLDKHLQHAAGRGKQQEVGESTFK